MGDCVFFPNLNTIGWIERDLDGGVQGEYWSLRQWILRSTGPGGTWLQLWVRRKRTSVNPAPATSRSLATTRHPTPYRWVSMATPMERNSWAGEAGCAGRVIRPPYFVSLVHFGRLDDAICLLKWLIQALEKVPHNLSQYLTMSRCRKNFFLWNITLLYGISLLGDQSKKTGEGRASQEEFRPLRSLLCPGESSYRVYSPVCLIGI